MRYDASPVNSLSVGVMPISNVNGKNTLGINLSYHFGADNPNSNENMTLNLLGYAKRVNQWSAADISGAALTVAGLTAAIAAGVALSSNSNNKAGQSDGFIWQAIRSGGPNGSYPEHYRQFMLVESINAANAAVINAVNNMNAANANSQAPQTPVAIAPDAVVQPTTMQITTPTITEQQNSVPTVPVATTAPTTAPTLPTTTDGYSLAAEAAINAAVAKTPPATGESKSGGGYIIK